MDCQNIISTAEKILMQKWQTEFCNAQPYMIHNALSEAVMQAIAHRWKASRDAHASVRRAYYFSAEYLMGRMVYNNLFSLEILTKIKELLENRGVDMSVFEDVDDVALGNGGLGRLAACFLDSAATHNLPLDGYGLRYKYGLFSQQIENGCQTEYADDWQKLGDPWSVRREDECLRIDFGDRSVSAVPYDMPIIGYKTSNIGTLRLFQCEALEGFDLSKFNNYEYFLSVHDKNIAENITSVLYPNDNTYDGKKLRIMQQYFLASAGMQDILRSFKKHNDDISKFAAHCAVQLNDTHPTIAIPELIRILTLEGIPFDDAFEIAKSTFSYTNHTLMIEALETWDINLFCNTVPNIYDIICRMNDKLNKTLLSENVSGYDSDKMQIVQGGKVHMANLASYASSHINGVAKIHSELLKTTVLAPWYHLYPDNFYNITNGITQRRFLGVCNPLLSNFIQGLLKTDEFLINLDLLSGIKALASDNNIEAFAQIKHANKELLAKRIYADTGIVIQPGFIFDVQIKRLHEYKRQLLNALTIYAIYKDIKANKLTDFSPTCFIFGAKAAASYQRAKGVIKYINELANLINSDSQMHDVMKVVFLPNYNTSYAEMIIPAADVSEQISPVGTEASGTGNMKLMLNGAVTLGTNDGANIEIAANAGYENNYIFSIATSPGEQSGYNPKRIYDSDIRIHNALDSLIDGTFSDNGSGIFRELYNSVLFGASWHLPDPYFILRDFNEYMDMKLKVNADYKDRIAFYRKCMMNTASSGFFSSDRTIREYADKIWHINRIKVLY